MKYPFNVRVYGLFLDRRRNVVVVDEDRSGHRFTKFPGGGLEFGEGLIDALKRECEEEMAQPISIDHHFYTTDFFQQSAFDKQAQIISVYYLVSPVGEWQVEFKKVAFDFKGQSGPEQLAFRWQSIDALTADDLDFPIDKHVLQLLKEL